MARRFLNKKTHPFFFVNDAGGTRMFAFRRVQQGYQWESYGPIAPVD